MDNYQQTVIRFSYLKRRMMKDQPLKKKCISVTETYTEKQYAQLATSKSNALSEWFLKVMLHIKVMLSVNEYLYDDLKEI